jgi:hypothetical protein
MYLFLALYKSNKAPPPSFAGLKHPCLTFLSYIVPGLGIKTLHVLYLKNAFLWLFSVFPPVIWQLFYSGLCDSSILWHLLLCLSSLSLNLSAPFPHQFSIFLSMPQPSFKPFIEPFDSLSLYPSTLLTTFCPLSAPFLYHIIILFISFQSPFMPFCAFLVSKNLYVAFTKILSSLRYLFCTLFSLKPLS